MDRNLRSTAFAAALGIALIGSGGCGSLRMTREAEQVLVTETARVDSCKPRGVVFALAPFSSPRQPLEQLKIRASQIGADTVVLKRDTNAPNGDWSGKAYRCGNAVAAAGEPSAELEAERQPD